MAYELEWTELSAADYNNLDGSEKVVVDKALKKIQVFGMQAGAALSGEMPGCRKLKHRKMGLRIIFRESPNGIEIIQIVSIGKREDLKAYHLAEKRIKE
jgi:mRNA interferase RelE/StbE